MTSSINRYCDSRVVKKAIAVASFATAIGLTRISAQEVFDLQATLTPILTVALPIIALVVSDGQGCLKGRKIEWVPSFVVIPYIIGAIVAIGLMALQESHPASFCSYYETCPNSQPHFVPECRRLQNECQSALQAASWRFHDLDRTLDLSDLHFGFDLFQRQVKDCDRDKYFGIAVASKFEAVAQLCRRIARPSIDYSRYDPKPCLFPKDEAFQRVVQLQQELANITHCHPDIDNNPYFRMISEGVKVIKVMNWAIMPTNGVLAGIYLVLYVQSLFVYQEKINRWSTRK